jgi:hypothetical protein
VLDLGVVVGRLGNLRLLREIRNEGHSDERRRRRRRRRWWRRGGRRRGGGAMGTGDRRSRLYRESYGVGNATGRLQGGDRGQP